MSFKMNSTCKMNELCQKHGFNALFEKTYENQKQKQFKMRLIISNPKNNKSLNYMGVCSTVQSAKQSASKRALSDDFVTKLKNSHYQTYTAYTRRDPEGDRRSDYDASSTAQSYSDIRVRQSDAPSQSSSDVRIVDEKNHIYDLYLAARRRNLKPKIEFVSSRRGTLTSEVVVKIVIGSKTTLGIGRDDLDAIQNSAKQIDPNLLISSETASLEKDKNDYVSELNIIHLQANQNLESMCLLLIENLNRPFYLFKCELGELVSYGLDDNKMDAQNQAALMMLTILRSKLEKDIYQLEKQAMDISIKKNNIERVLNKMKEMEDNRKLKSAFGAH